MNSIFINYYNKLIGLFRLRQPTKQNKGLRENVTLFSLMVAAKWRQPLYPMLNNFCIRLDNECDSHERVKFLTHKKLPQQVLGLKIHVPLTTRQRVRWCIIN
ncbi:hypothetical protein RGI85_001050 [Serratia marcescens]